MESRKTGNAPAHFNVGDLVRVKDLPNLFYSRTQMYVRGVRGTIAARTYEDLLPEDEAWNRDDAQPEQFYIVPLPAEGSLGRISVRERHAANRTAGSLARTRRRLMETGNAIKGPPMAQT